MSIRSFSLPIGLLLAALAASLAPFLLGPAPAAPPPPGGDVDSADVSRILRFLADDRLQGRGSFTPGSEEAAVFIAAEFASAGLFPQAGSDSIIDRFTVRRVVRESVSVALNGAAVRDEDLIVSTELDRGDWSLGDTFPATAMGEKFDRELLRGTNRILLVPRVHAQLFSRYRRFLNRPRTYYGEPEPGVLVAILTDTVTAAACTVTLRGRTETPSLLNVVGVIPGKRKDDVLLFSAHYDHLGIVRPVNGDSIANGADDDASGTTALVALAKVFAASGTPERTLMFAAFAAEEIGGFGSRRLLDRMKPESIAAMVNLEMVGTVSKFGPGTFWLTGYERSSLGRLIGEELEGSGWTLHPDPYPEENLFFRSDNAVFARAGVPAHSLSTTRIDVDSLYHTVDDEFDRIDVSHLAGVVRGVARGVRGLVNGTQTPGRITLE
jgi:hypothetical protein